MEYKKYIIFEDIIRCVMYLNLLNNSLKEKGLIKTNETWDVPRKVGDKTDSFSKRYWLKKPIGDFFDYSTKELIQESTDEVPWNKNEPIYKIYRHINEDADKKITNYLVPPSSLNYKHDVGLRFVSKNTFDQYGNLIKVEYFEKSKINIDSFGIRNEEYENKILDVFFEYIYESDGYLSHRNVKRRWYKEDGEYFDLDKTKYYDNNNAKFAGTRRRQNIKNIIENKAATALFLTKGPIEIGGDGTLNNVAQADNFGKPLLNSLEPYFNRYISNNEFVELRDAIADIDTEKYQWALNIDPFTGVNIIDLCVSILNDSSLD